MAAMTPWPRGPQHSRGGFRLRNFAGLAWTCDVGIYWGYNGISGIHSYIMVYHGINIYIYILSYVIIYLYQLISVYVYYIVYTSVYTYNYIYMCVCWDVLESGIS